MIEKPNHWDQFYETFSRQPSQFCNWTCSYWLPLSAPDTSCLIYDIGCGDGSDAEAMANCGHRVVACDKSINAGKKCMKASFHRGDAILILPHSPVVDVIYARWLLHSMTPEAADALLRCCAEALRPGGWFIAEFRTQECEGDHYRRAVSLEEARAHCEQAGLEVRHLTAANGRSPVGDDDPELGRIVATRVV